MAEQNCTVEKIEGSLDETSHHPQAQQKGMTGDDLHAIDYTRGKERKSDGQRKDVNARSQGLMRGYVYI
jgi:hypothetical protein